VVALREKHPDSLVLAGGSPGVAKTAERAWLALGGKCWSYRPKQIDSRTYGVEIWKLGGRKPKIEFLSEEPTFANFASAAHYRSWLMLHAATRVVSFYNGWSPGTMFEIHLAVDLEKPLYHHGPPIHR